MKGELITDLNEILRLYKEGKSVWVEPWGRTCPAAFLQNWTLREIGTWASKKHFFYYNK